MNGYNTTFDPNILVDEGRIQRGIEIVDLINKKTDQTWGEYVTKTVNLFDLTQDIFDPAIDEQMTRLTLLLPDLQIAEGLQSAELPEMKRAAITAVQRALLVRRQEMDFADKNF